MQRKIRQSQTLTPFGVGAIFDFRGESFVACDTWRWGSRGTNVRSERLCQALGVRQLKAAPVVESGAWAPPALGIPYYRFPTWLFCQHCRGMLRWRLSLEQEGKVPLCPVCTGKKQLVPMRWIVICEAGHMGDVDWKRWAHSRGKAGTDQGKCEKESLAFETLPSLGAGGLDTLQIRCRSCGAKRSLMGITAADAMKNLGRCPGRQPWQRWEDAVDCTAVPRAVQRGASNVYFPLVHSSIEIPNPSRADADSEKALEIKNDTWYAPLLTVNLDSPQAAMMVEQLANLHEVSEDYVRDIVRDDKARAEGKATAVAATSGDLLGEEWAAFVTPDASDDPDFQTRHVGLGESGSSLLAAALQDRIHQVVVADRLREVRALEGFHRVTPSGDQNLVRVDLGRNLPWLPAVEVLGEGIFLSLEETRLAAWEELEPVADRAAEMDKRIDRSFMAARFRERTGPRLTPRYLLLHSLAHQLIRRLAFESGYAAASLRERVYARTPLTEGEARQAGILLYTAAGDSEGTLGGLVRQGEPPRFSRILLEALQDAMWCSADPLCGENKATSLNSLNFSACHACSLVSETSCESGNFLLDRAVLIGADGVPGYFEPVVQLALDAAASEVTSAR
ncbi:MAG: DrmB family protein [Mycobacteriaceae bacterium]